MKYNSIITVPLRGIVLFPGVDSTFEAGRSSSINALKTAFRTDSFVFCVTQHNTKDDYFDNADLFNFGTIGKVTQIRSNSDTASIIATVSPLFRAKRKATYKSEGHNYFESDVELIDDIPCADPNRVQAFISKIADTVNEFVDLCGLDAKSVPAEIFFPSSLDEQIYSTATSIFRDIQTKQTILSESSVSERAKTLIYALKDLIRTIEVEQKIDMEVQEALDRNQEDFFLREKLNVLKNRLNIDEGESSDEAREYEEKILALNLPEESTEDLLKECRRLEMMQPSSPDANVIRNYLDEVLKIPWNVYTRDNIDIQKAKKILENDHYGLEKIKERFLELIAVNKYTENTGAQIICLVGPPGVGKTSVASSVARAMGKKYVRMSLGGVHDEAEIRGHRKTYIGAIPGRIISALERAKSMNPIMLLDEIDKLANDGRGDPSSALLEVLDPEQNNSFRDNYIALPVDLSKVVFITTANDPTMIPQPLYDRMEIIELPGYTFEEKLQIAKQHLIKKQRKAHGLTASMMKLPDSTLKFLIDFYTKEAGVRRLEQIIASLCRKTLIFLDESGKRSVTVTKEKAIEWLGPEKFRDDEALKDDLVGVVNGLAWTAVGGEMLQVEALLMPGSGKIELTGNLGDVMKESAKAAFSFIRANADKYGIENEQFTKNDIHIHVPQGAVPKDGPSAGVTISTAILSALTKRSFRHEIAMTGEISLTGRVMPIGGLREKSMAAYKSGIKKVIIPKDNVSDLYDVHPTVSKNVEFLPVSSLNEVFSISLNQ